MVLSADSQAGTVSVAGPSRCIVTAAVEDVCHKIVDEDFASLVIESIDLFDAAISELVDDYCRSATTPII